MNVKHAYSYSLQFLERNGVDEADFKSLCLVCHLAGINNSEYSLHTDDFINENILLHNDVVVIIHGKSTDILTKVVHKVLSNNKRIKKYYLDNWNLGQTIVELKDNL